MVEISILADNTVVEPFPRELRGEWCFSAAIDGVLLDTGQSVAVHNTTLLGVPVVELDAIVLSHTHFDHTAGLMDFLNVIDDPTVYLHPEVWTPRYADRDDGFDDAPLGIPYERSTIEAKATVVEHREPVEVADGIHALGKIPRPHVETVIGTIETDDGWVADPIVDDQALAVETGDRVVLILGCFDILSPLTGRDSSRSGSSGRPTRLDGSNFQVRA